MNPSKLEAPAARSAPPPPDVALDLRTAADELKRELGARSPAYVTLKRHAADGLLSAYEAKPPLSAKASKRKLYRREALIRHYRIQRAEPVEQGHAPVSAPGAAFDHEAMSLIVAAAVRSALDPIAARLDQVERRVADLIGVRQSLQLKYDSANALALDRADRLAAENASLRRSQDIEPMLSRIRSDISRVMDRLGELGR